MALTMTGEHVNDLYTLLENASFTNVDVIKGIVPRSSRANDELAKKFTRGNATIVVMPLGHKPNVAKQTTQKRVIRYEANTNFRIGIYSKFINTVKDEDLLKLYDNVVNLAHNNRYIWLGGDISDATHSFHNINYYQATIDIQQQIQYTIN